ncbi:MAG: 4-(cytidine 5'-diphospho)-2-C-methyl-D-erythritol kinase [Cytophagales bacterium]|nr:MAG: 4-(cytidine 5'-diphospho)-2-C-methyl-D-erythritol kinase [Cytophagales bacterium]
MLVFPNAKINLGLHIINKREDGFHNLETCFLPIQWQDMLEIAENNVDTFSTSGIEIKGDSKDNLCLKALQLLRNDFKIPTISIHLHKSIPMGAGLGGGSSDAAFLLQLLNNKFSLKITNSDLINYAKKLGSDCAFFIQNKPIFATEKGDIFSDINLQLSGYQVFVAYSDIHVSTAEAYSFVKPRKENSNLKLDLLKPIKSWKNTIFNDFELSVFTKHPILADLKQKMYDNGAIYASMSGSGSAIYGIFDTNKDAYFLNNLNYNVTIIS